MDFSLVGPVLAIIGAVAGAIVTIWGLGVKFGAWGTKSKSLTDGLEASIRGLTQALEHLKESLTRRVEAVEVSQRETDQDVVILRQQQAQIVSTLSQALKELSNMQESKQRHAERLVEITAQMEGQKEALETFYNQLWNPLQKRVNSIDQRTEEIAEAVNRVIGKLDRS